jgi:hypothetical protein
MMTGPPMPRATMRLISFTMVTSTVGTSSGDEHVGDFAEGFSGGDW